MTRVVTKEIIDNLYVLRVDDTKTRFFESLWEIPEGITYNAYLVKTRDGDVLIDGWKSIYASEFIEALESITELDRIRYVIVQHMEPDHTGSLKTLLSRTVNARVLSHPMSQKMMAKFYRISPPFKPVKNLEELDVGGYRFSFIYAPWIHWPETIFTYMRNEGLLFTCDAFGGYSIPPCITDEECIPEDYLYYAEKYMATVVGTYRRNLVAGIDKLSKLGLKIKAVLPGHGLIWMHDPQFIIELYRRWGLGTPERKALIIHTTMYGATDSLAVKIRSKLASRGYRVVEKVFNDTSRPLVSDVIGEANSAKLIVLIAGTYEAGLHPIARYILGEITDKISPEGRKILLASAHGWGAGAEREVRRIIEGKKFELSASVYIDADDREIEEAIDNSLKD